MYCQKLDYIPLVELIIDKKVKEAFLEKPVNDIKTDIEFWSSAGYDYILLMRAPNFQPEDKVWSNEHNGAITTMEDFEEKYHWPSPREIDYSEFEEASRSLPDGMKIIAETGGFFYYVWSLMGFERFCFVLQDNPLLVEQMFNKVGSLIFDIVENYVHLDDIGAIWIANDMAYTEGLMISPQILRRYVFPWFKKVGQLCQYYKLPFILHSDGNLWEIMEDLIYCGVNALHPIEPKAMNAENLKAKFGDRLCLLGNIDLDRLIRGTPQEIEISVKSRIEKFGFRGGYCVGSSNTITSDVPIENYKAMIEATIKYGDI